ncbi:MAG: hypothetical protein MPJ22_00375 [Pirellulales bacterium]|nr:hypothetical protein [Pirellulales bacterium]
MIARPAMMLEYLARLDIQRLTKPPTVVLKISPIAITSTLPLLTLRNDPPGIEKPSRGSSNCGDLRALAI